MCAGSAARTGEGERLASKASSCARCLRRAIWDSTIPSTKAQGGCVGPPRVDSVSLRGRGKRADIFPPCATAPEVVRSQGFKN